MKTNYGGPIAHDTRLRYRAELHRVDVAEDNLVRLGRMLRNEPERFKNVMRYKHRRDS